MKLRRVFPLLLAAGAFALVACGSSSTAATSPSPSSAASTSTPSSAATPSAAATTIDPCQLVTSQEASSLTGASFGPGTEQPNNGSQSCVYGAQTLNVFEVLVAQAPDAATALAEWAQEQAQAQSVLAKAASAGVNINLNPNDVNVAGADKAAVATGSYPIGGQTFNVSVIYVIKGAVFFTFSDLTVGSPAPSASAMEAQAQTTIGRLP